jgi:hypothetical protein
MKKMAITILVQLTLTVSYPGFHIFLDLINKDSLGTENRNYDNLGQWDLFNESSTISRFHKTGREGVRPEA